MTSRLLTVSTSPHVLGCSTIRSFHLEIIIALAPALLVGLYYFGLPGLITVFLSVISAMAAEYIYCRIAKLPVELDNLHAALMGLMLGMLLPAGASWYVPFVGGGLTIVVGKMFFGGMGAYPMNPVLVAWAAMSISWPEQMNAFYAPLAEGGEWEVTETLLMQLKEDVGVFEIIEMPDLWLGLTPGAIGTTCAWALMAGGVYLIIRRIISWRIPFGVLAATFVMALVVAYTDENIAELGYETFGEHLKIAWFHMGAGGLMIAAFFMAPEPVSSPVTPNGMLLFGLGVGLMAVIVRSWGALPDGVYYAVLVMNAATPLFDRIRPKVLGKVVA